MATQNLMFFTSGKKNSLKDHVRRQIGGYSDWIERVPQAVAATDSVNISDVSSLKLQKHLKPITRVNMHFLVRLRFNRNLRLRCSFDSAERRYYRHPVISAGTTKRNRRYRPDRRLSHKPLVLAYGNS